MLNINTKKYMKNNKKTFVSIFAIYFSTIIVAILTSLYVLLLKQIQNLNIDNSSFQAFYVADSAMDCGIYKEKTATDTASFFNPSNYSTFGYCANPGDINWETIPTENSGRSRSVLKHSIDTREGEFCGQITTDRLISDLGAAGNVGGANAAANTMNILGQSRPCNSSDQKVVERGIDFSY
jgi:hypothetical protein